MEPKMEELIRLINENNYTKIFISLGIIILFWCISSIFATAIIKLFTNRKRRKKLNPKESPFFRPIKTLMNFAGIYIAYVISKDFIEPNLQIIIEKIIKISMIILVSKAFVNGISHKNFIRSLKNRAGREFDETTNKLLIRITKIGIYIFEVFAIISELGYDISGFITGLGITGVVITLAAQDTAKSLIGGLAIFLDRPFKVGDYIKFEDFEGTVEDIKFRSTCVRTLEDTVLHIPNSKMAEVTISNYNEMNRRRYLADLVIDKGVDLNKISSLKRRIENTLQSRNDIAKNSIMINFVDILGYGNKLRISAYVKETNYNEFLKKKEQINYQIIEIFKEEQVPLVYNFLEDIKK